MCKIYTALCILLTVIMDQLFPNNAFLKFRNGLVFKALKTDKSGHPLLDYLINLTTLSKFQGTFASFDPHNPCHLIKKLHAFTDHIYIASYYIAGYLTGPRS